MSIFRLIGIGFLTLSTLDILLACHNNSDPQGLANGLNVLFVDQNNCNCVDTHTRINALNPNTPFCSFDYGFVSALPGDTVYVRQGRYEPVYTGRRPSNNGAANARITFKGYPGEKPIYTSYRLMDSPSDWTACASAADCDGNPNWSQIYYVNLPPVQPPFTVTPFSIASVAQDDVPLALVDNINGVNYLHPWQIESSARDIKAEGQWARSSIDWKVWLWPKGGGNPGQYKTEISYFPNGGASTFELHDPMYGGLSAGPQPDYLTFDNLILEGGHSVFSITVDHIEIKNCEIRKAYGHAIKVQGANPAQINPATDSAPWRSENGLIENNDIHHNGRTHIGINGARNWIVRGNKIHDSVPLFPSLPHGSQSDAITLKDNNIGSIVENNEIYNVDVWVMAAVNIGGVSNGGIGREGVDLIVRNNIIRHVTAYWLIAFASCHNCKFYNNMVFQNTANYAVLMQRSNAASQDPLTMTVNPQIKNNIFYYGAENAYQSMPNSTSGLESDYNLFYPPMATGLDAHSIFESPVLTNPVGNDFRPLPGSPTIDAGTNLGQLVRYDKNGTLRPKGKAYDIGPYEYLSVTSPHQNSNNHALLWQKNAFNPLKQERAEVQLSILGEPQHIKAKILDRKGEFICELMNETRAADTVLSWDGKTPEGENASSGIYLFVIEIEGEKYIEKVVVLK